MIEDDLVLGWRVIDEDGNIIDSGPVTVAEMSDETRTLMEEQ